MYIEKGTIFALRPIDEKEINSLEEHDRKVLKNILETIKPMYLLCLRRLDNVHCLCACIKSIKRNNSIQITTDTGELLWANFAQFIDVNINYAMVAYESTNYLRNVVSTVYNEHNSFKEHKRQKRIIIREAKLEEKRINKENARLRRERRKEERTIARQNQQFDAKMKSKLGLAKAKSNNSSGSGWNAQNPCSAGRGNF